MNWQKGRQLASATNGTTSVSYTYDSEGLRLTKATGDLVYHYYYADGKLVRIHLYKGATSWQIFDFFYDQNGHPYALNHKVGGVYTTYYYLTNLQGDVLGMVKADGTTVATYTYDPYGKPLTATGTFAATNPLRYRGYCYDTETGFYYVSSRYYDPAIGRWINADSIIEIDAMLGSNLFVYCDNSPINKVDYSGEDGKYFDLGHGWKYTIHPQDTNSATKRHIHLTNGKTEYIQNDDGSPHDKGKGQRGKIPGWLNKKLNKKAGWDYNGKRESFFKKTTCKYFPEGTQYTFADGTVLYQSQQLFLRNSVDSNESVYFQNNTISNCTNDSNQIFYLPIFGQITLPSFFPGFSFGFMPIPLLF